MPFQLRDTPPPGTSKSIFLFLLLAVFASELAVMELFASWYPRMGRISSAFLDSSILVLLFSLPLCLVVYQPRPAVLRQFRPVATTFFQKHLFGKVLATIFAVNFFIMLFQPEIWAGANPRPGVLLDAVLVTAAAAPFLWKLLYRTTPPDPAGTFQEALGTPLGIFVLLLSTVLSADLLQGSLLSLVLPRDLDIPFPILDSILTTAMVAPVFWLVVARPLRSAALAERTRKGVILGQLLDGVITTDSAGIVESINPAAERIFNLRPDEIVGQPAARLLIEGHVFKDLLAGAVSGEHVAQPFVEVAGRRPDGLSLTLEVSRNPIMLNDRREFLLVMRDISSRKEVAQALRESELRFREIFEQSEDAIVFFKPGSCSIIDVNITTCRLFGFTREELLAGGVEILFDSEGLARLKAMVSGVQKKTVSPIEAFTAKRKCGEEFITAMRCKIMTLQGVDVVFCNFRDVTDRLRMEQEAREIQAKLIQANKMTSLGLLVSGVAHEINNPNNFILANSGLLARSWEDARHILREYANENGEFFLGGVPFSELDASSTELFDGILDGARRINEIVKNLKGFARQDQLVAEGNFDLNQVVTSAVSILHHEMVRYTEHFQLDLAAELQPVSGSAQQIGQVVINLLMNACQALPAKNHGIWLTTALDPESEQAVISVRDEGCGMSSEQSRRIMEPFFTTKLDTGGTGLGLSICQSIVREHHGSLEFSSEPGRGSTFSVRLPVALPQKDVFSCPS